MQNGLPLFTYTNFVPSTLVNQLQYFESAVPKWSSPIGPGNNSIVSPVLHREHVLMNSRRRPASGLPVSLRPS